MGYGGGGKGRNGGGSPHGGSPHGGYGGRSGGGKGHREYDENMGADNDAVNVTGGSGDPWRTWQECADGGYFPTGLIDYLFEDAKFPKPTAIQAYTWPILMAKRNVVGIAKTGSGKTLAFLLPAFIMCDHYKPDVRRNGPAILVCAPTRELAVQIENEAARFGKPVNITSSVAYGGAPRNSQLRELRRGPHAIIGCPGRLNDFIQSGQLVLSECYYCVLDEADRMLDMGFEPQIRSILHEVPGIDARQTCMFTATWPQDVRQLARDFIKDPILVQVGSQDPLTGNKDITQHVVICENEDDKRTALLEILNGMKETNGNALIFQATKRGCSELQRKLSYSGVPCNCMHGDMEQRERENNLWKFKTGETRVMVATDVAGRGLDLRNVSIVVNWDPANNAEDHTHRVGRTGRAGDKGDAYTFLSRRDTAKAKDVMQTIKKTGQTPPEELMQIIGRGGGGGGGWQRGGAGNWGNNRNGW